MRFRLRLRHEWTEESAALRQAELARFIVLAAHRITADIRAGRVQDGIGLCAFAGASISRWISDPKRPLPGSTPLWC